jgi:radical SAM protein with 4Fe4S-binding SPASM domain
MNATFLATLSYRTSFWIDEFFDVAARTGVSSMNFTRFISQGNGRKLEESSEDRPLAPHELRQAYLAILEAAKRTGVSTSTNGPLYHLIDPELGANGKLGFQGLVVDFKGNLKVTSRTDFRLGNILEEGLENLFLRHPVMKALRDREIEVCGSCVHYDNCGGDRNASFAATGSFLKKDPGCWLDVEPQSVAQEVS